MGYSEICFRMARGQKIVGEMRGWLSFDRAPFESKSRNNPYGEPACRLSPPWLFRLEQGGEGLCKTKKLKEMYEG